MDYWALALPRFIQGFAVGFIFVPLSTLTLATIRRDKLVNATAVYGMLRNIGGSVGIAVVTTLLAQRSQFHQATLVSHVTVWDPETRARLARWASHFAAQGSDAFTAERRAMAMLYRETVTQAQLLAYADDFWLLAVMFAAVPLFLPLMRRIRLAPAPAAAPGEPARERTGGRAKPCATPPITCRYALWEEPTMDLIQTTPITGPKAWRGDRPRPRHLVDRHPDRGRDRRHRPRARRRARPSGRPLDGDRARALPAHRACAPRLEQAVAEMYDGRGFVVLRGLPVRPLQRRRRRPHLLGLRPLHGRAALPEPAGRAARPRLRPRAHLRQHRRARLRDQRLPAVPHRRRRHGGPALPAPRRSRAGSAASSAR